MPRYTPSYIMYHISYINIIQYIYIYYIIHISHILSNINLYMLHLLCVCKWISPPFPMALARQREIVAVQAEVSHAQLFHTRTVRFPNLPEQWKCWVTGFQVHSLASLNSWCTPGTWGSDHCIDLGWFSRSFDTQLPQIWNGHIWVFWPIEDRQ